MKWVLFLALLSSSAIAQKTSAKPETPAFVCPDPEAKVACQSFVENKEWPLAGNQVLCFRQKDDQYFSLNFAPAGSRYDPKTHTVDTLGYVGASTFDHGVESRTLTPTFLVDGSWLVTHFQGIFTPNVKKQVFMEYMAISFSGRNKIDTVHLQLNYENPDKESVTYTLDIAGVSGRFHESWRTDARTLKDSYGRCILGPQHFPDVGLLEKEYESNCKKQGNCEPE